LETLLVKQTLLQSQVLKANAWIFVVAKAAMEQRFKSTPAMVALIRIGF